MFETARSMEYHCITASSKKRAAFCLQYLALLLDWKERMPRFLTRPLIMRVPFSLLFCFDKEKGKRVLLRHPDGLGPELRLNTGYP